MFLWGFNKYRNACTLAEFNFGSTTNLVEDTKIPNNKELYKFYTDFLNENIWKLPASVFNDRTETKLIF